MIIYPEVSFTEEWKEGRRFERERIIKIFMNALCTKDEGGQND